MSLPLLASLALSYPDREILAAREGIAVAVDDLPDSVARLALARFASWWVQQEPSVLASHYVEVFDMSRRTGLDLTYPTFGDRRQRGLALVALKQRYRDAGFELDTNELPDHLPVVLEYVARAGADGVAVLGTFRPQLEVLHLALEQISTPYAGVLAAVCTWMPELTDAEAAEVRRMIADGPPVEDVGLEPFAPPEFMPAARGLPPGCDASPAIPALTVQR